MIAPSIFFFSEEIKFVLKHKKKTKAWIKEILQQENKKLGNLNLIFCSDEYLHKINIKYLKHNSVTDVIAFDLSEDNEVITGDIFISINRVKDNSKTFNNSFVSELNRVISHGILHLIGYNDKTPQEASVIRMKEDKYLSLLPDFILK